LSIGHYSDSVGPVRILNSSFLRLPVSLGTYSPAEKSRTTGVSSTAWAPRFRRTRLCQRRSERPRRDVIYGVRPRLHFQGHWTAEISRDRSDSKCCSFKQTKNICPEAVSSIRLGLQGQRLPHGCETQRHWWWSRGVPKSLGWIPKKSSAAVKTMYRRTMSSRLCSSTTKSTGSTVSI